MAVITTVPTLKVALCVPVRLGICSKMMAGVVLQELCLVSNGFCTAHVS